jgi:osmoprotectant transport system permease protein
VSAQLALLPGYLTAHLQLTLVALLAGIAFSVPAGIAVTRVRWLEQPVTAAASVIQTIPGLALLAVMVPLLAALGLQSIGFLPALVGLTLYSVLPILRNTATGLTAVDPALVEAARGVGMTPLQQLWRVELPVALPVIVAGIRTATVWTVGMATLATPVGATSLGNYIFTGLQTRNFTAVLVGCVAASALALLLDALVRLLETGLARRRRGLTAAALAGVALLCAYAGAALLPAGGAVAPVRIGAKTFTEQYILSDILALQIRRRTGLPTEAVQSLGSTVAFDALRTGALDVYVDYSGTIWATIMRRTTLPSNRADVLAEVERYLRQTDGITLVGPLGFENAYALALRERDAERLDVRTISDLAPFAPRLSIGGDYEFFARPEWRDLEQAYGLRFRDRRSMDSSLMYQAAAAGEVDVISAFSTDGRIAAFDLRVLQDDRGAIPPYDAVLLAGPSLARDRPQVVDALRSLVGTIDASRMRRMNLAVDEKGETPAAVAAAFVGGGREPGSE